MQGYKMINYTQSVMHLGGIVPDVVETPFNSLHLSRGQPA